ncbi:hypothetical protein ABN327_08295 [Providencia huaxiensis]|uniref:hypothetical protein n=1 Tax=Providencia huaxiensis TaxID=2027290 RepID=UPI0032DABE1D
MADIIKNQIVNGLIPVSHNGRVTACTSDGKVIGGIISCSVESDCREIVRMTLTVEVRNREGNFAIGRFNKTDKQEIEANFSLK